MRRFLSKASPELYFVFSAALGAVIAAVLARFEPLDLGFWPWWGILLSLDVVTYVAMKAGWMKTPRQRSGTDP